MSEPRVEDFFFSFFSAQIFIIIDPLTISFCPVLSLDVIV